MIYYKLSDDQKAITCLKCGMTSHSPLDVGMRYCGNCHEWIGEPICDFCSGDYPIVKDYTAVSKFIGGIFEDGRPLVDADSLWSACEDCSVLIEAREWEALLIRCLGCINAKWAPLERAIDPEILREKLIFFWRGVFGDTFSLK